MHSDKPIVLKPKDLGFTSCHPMPGAEVVLDNPDAAKEIAGLKACLFDSIRMTFSASYFLFVSPGFSYSQDSLEEWLRSQPKKTRPICPHTGAPFESNAILNVYLTWYLHNAETDSDPFPHLFDQLVDIAETLIFLPGFLLSDTGQLIGHSAIDESSWKVEKKRQLIIDYYKKQNITVRRFVPDFMTRHFLERRAELVDKYQSVQRPIEFDQSQKLFSIFTLALECLNKSQYASALDAAQLVVSRFLKINAYTKGKEKLEDKSVFFRSALLLMQLHMRTSRRIDAAKALISLLPYLHDEEISIAYRMQAFVKIGDMLRSEKAFKEAQSEYEKAIDAYQQSWRSANLYGVASAQAFYFYAMAIENKGYAIKAQMKAMRGELACEDKVALLSESLEKTIAVVVHICEQNVNTFSKKDELIQAKNDAHQLEGVYLYLALAKAFFLRKDFVNAFRNIHFAKGCLKEIVNMPKDLVTQELMIKFTIQYAIICREYLNAEPRCSDKPIEIYPYETVEEFFDRAESFLPADKAKSICITFHKGILRNSREVLENALLHNRNNANLLLELGLVLLQLADFAKARGVLEQAIQRSNAFTRAHMAYVYASVREIVLSGAVNAAHYEKLVLSLVHCVRQCHPGEMETLLHFMDLRAAQLSPGISATLLMDLLVVVIKKNKKYGEHPLVLSLVSTVNRLQQKSGQVKENGKRLEEARKSKPVAALEKTKKSERSSRSTFSFLDSYRRVRKQPAVLEAPSIRSPVAPYPMMKSSLRWATFFSGEEVTREEGKSSMLYSQPVSYDLLPMSSFCASAPVEQERVPDSPPRLVGIGSSSLWRRRPVDEVAQRLLKSPVRSVSHFEALSDYYREYFGHLHSPVRQDFVVAHAYPLFDRLQHYLKEKNQPCVVFLEGVLKAVLIKGQSFERAVTGVTIFSPMQDMFDAILAEERQLTLKPGCF